MFATLSRKILTQKENEVWDFIHEYTKHIITGKSDNFSKYIHDNFVGWDSIKLLPTNKADFLMELHYADEEKIIEYSIAPVSIKIFNEVAIVHYFFTKECTGSDQKTNLKRTKNTDVLIHDESGWRLIGDYVDVTNQ